MALKLVRAKRQGSYYGHRWRAGAVFPVGAHCNESWFEDVGPAPEGTTLPTNLNGPQAPVAKNFVQIMQELGQGKEQPDPSRPAHPQTLSQAAGIQAPDSDDLL